MPGREVELSSVVLGKRCLGSMPPGRLKHMLAGQVGLKLREYFKRVGVKGMNLPSCVVENSRGIGCVDSNEGSSKTNCATNTTQRRTKRKSIRQPTVSKLAL